MINDDWENDYYICEESKQSEALAAGKYDSFHTVNM